MPTLKELMGDKTRGDGRKFTKSWWDKDQWFEPIFYYEKEKSWVGLNAVGWMDDVDGPGLEFDHWQEWMPLKQTKKLKLYSPVIKTSDNNYVLTSMFGCEEHRKTYSDKNVVGWHEIEVEVSE